MKASCDKDSQATLRSAVDVGDMDTCRLLLEHGANPGIRNKKGELPEDLTSDSALIALLQGCRKA